MTTRPEFLLLTPEECAAVLDRNQVGRLAFIRDRAVDIVPIHYVTAGEWIFFRSARGGKVDALSRNPYAAFEVDEVDGPFDWRSVVMRGTIYLLPEDGAPIERREFQRAIEALRGVVPATMTAADPVPERTVVYGLHVGERQGRMATTRSTADAHARVHPPAPTPPRVTDQF